jgi:predicted HD phosphohydrolase
MIGEPITQTQHAIQTSLKLRRWGAPASLQIAGLFHDIGHLLEKKPFGPDKGVDDFHELRGAKLLALHRLSPKVYMPIMYHVDAKRCLASDPYYLVKLSDASRKSLELQGGAMGEMEAEAFRSIPHANAALMLRAADDDGKDIKLADLPELDSFEDLFCRVWEEGVEQQKPPPPGSDDRNPKSWKGVLY